MYRQSKQAIQQVLDSGKQHHRNIAAEICNNKIYFKSKRSSNRSSTAVGSAIELQRPKFAITKYTKNKQAVQHVCIKLHQIIEPKFAIRKCTYKVRRVSIVQQFLDSSKRHHKIEAAKICNTNIQYT